jgi:hypothetical protein
VLVVIPKLKHPFPFRTVKSFRVDGTWPARAWKSRSLPALVPLIKKQKTSSLINTAHLQLQMKTFVMSGLLSVFFVFLATVGYSSELMMTADQLDASGVQIQLHGGKTQYEPVVRINNGESIEVPTSGGSTTIFGDSNADVEMEAEYESAVLDIAVRPREGLTYLFKIGRIENFDLSYSSGSQTNSLQSLSQGFIWGVGLKWNAALGTIVSSAISFDLSYSRKSISLERFNDMVVTLPSSTKFEEDEFQAAMTVSHRFHRFEPYGGLKIARLETRLKDDYTKDQVEGHSDSLSPFIGLRAEIFQKELVTIEASFLDETSIHAGLGIQF